MRSKFVLFLSTLVVGIFLVAAVPVVANACSETGGECQPGDAADKGDTPDMCISEDDPANDFCVAEDDPADDDGCGEPGEIRDISDYDASCDQSWLDWYNNPPPLIEIGLEG